MTFLPYLYQMKKLRPSQLIFFSFGICAMFVSLIGCNGDRTYSVRTETIEVDSLNQIIPLTEPLVNPVLYTHVSGLSRLSPAESKVKFVEIVLPAILVAKFEMDKLQARVDKLRKKKNWTETDSIFYLETKSRFKAKDLEDLSSRIGTLPTSIVLAQAAVESGWGQSRFFLEGNNLFGVWSYNEDEPRIAAGLNRQGKTIYIRAYADMSESIIHYFEVLGSANAYRSLREARQKEMSPFELLRHLQNYSERRTSYTDLLKEVILQNEFTKYDKFGISPNYLERD